MAKLGGRRRLLQAVTAFAAAAAVAVAVLGVRVAQQESRLDEFRAELEGDRLAQAAGAALAAPGSEVVTLTAPEEVPEAEATIVLQADGVGYLISDGLPALSPDRTYQLWAIVGTTVVSAGVLGPDPGVSPFQVTGEIAGLAITEEVAGGVVASENDPVVLWLRNG